MLMLSCGEVLVLMCRVEKSAGALTARSLTHSLGVVQDWGGPRKRLFNRVEVKGLYTDFAVRASMMNACGMKPGS